MFAKFSFYLAFAVLVSSVLASPKEHRDNDSSEEHDDHHSGDDHGQDHGHDHHHHHHHHHGGNETKHGMKGGECHVKLNPDSPFMKVKNLSEALYTEFFVIASGDNYKSPQVSNDVHVNARAIVLFSQNLTYMPKAYQVIFNVTSTYALKGASVDGKETMTVLINDLTAQFGRRAGEEFFVPLKSNVSDSFIARGKYFKSGATPQEQAEAYDKWLRDPFVGAATMHRLFLRAAWKNDKPSYILRAMVNYLMKVNVLFMKEGDEKSEKLQNIYAAAIAKTVQTVCPAHELHKAAIVFYQNLMELLSEDAELLVKLYSGGGMVPGMMYDDKPF